MNGSSKLEPVVTLICENNSAMTMDEVPLESLKAQLDVAPFDERRILTFEIGDAVVEEMIEAKKNKRRKLPFDNIDVETEDQARPSISQTQQEVHEYSDEEEDIDDSYNGAITMLDAIAGARRGLDSHAADNEPTSPFNNDVIEDPVDVDIDLTRIQWTRCDFNDVEDDPLAFNNQTKATPETLTASECPLSMFLHMVPHFVWDHIASCTEEKRLALVSRQSQDMARKDHKYMKTPIVTQRIFIFVCVLILNMLQPYAGGMSNHWRTDGRMLRRPGIMGQIMPRDEFRCISRCLCFYDPSKLDKGDKFTKIRYVVDSINRCFQKAIRLGPWVSFDEATVSTKSSKTPARQYNPFKPHKFGWKLFMMCCAVINYCFSFELYQGKPKDTAQANDAEEKEQASEADVAVAQSLSEEPISRLDDTTTGPAALLRNCAWMAGSHRTVFCDRYYTSIGAYHVLYIILTFLSIVGVFLKLHSMGINAVGTIMGNRKGLSNMIKFTPHEVKTLARGSLKMVKYVIEGTSQHMLAMGWLDTKPVYMISNMRSREDFYLDLAEQMYCYTGFDTIPKTRSAKSSTPIGTPKLATPTNKSASIRCTFDGHCAVEYVARPKLTRQNKKKVESES